MSILCYHAVEDDWESPLALSPAVFEAQCAWLSRRRRVIPLRDAVKRLKGWRRLPTRTTALTFDDGFAALYDNAWQVMARYNIPSTMFIVARTLSAEGHAVDWVDTPPKHEMRCLTIEQILEMQASGVEFGSHTLFHHDLRELSDDECERDLRESKEMLEDLLGRPVPFLAYPRGFNNVRVQRSAERAGYSHAFTLPTEPERPGPYAIPRAGIYAGNSMRALAIKTHPYYIATRTSPLLSPVRRLRSR
jgi:peptidoglycan/xylan/chitin deacetylase (PgdA/CDA1 family)